MDNTTNLNLKLLGFGEQNNLDICCVKNGFVKK